MTTVGALADRSKHELAILAQRRGIRGWDSMTKDALLKALTRHASPTTSSTKATKLAKPTASKPAAKSAARANRVAVASAKRTAKTANRPTAKRPAKAVAKLTHPEKRSPSTKPVAAPRVAGVMRQGVNGTHGTGRVAPANGHPKSATQQQETPAVATKAPPAPDPKARPVAKPAAAPLTQAKSTVPVKDTATAPRPLSGPPAKDRIILAVNDPYWLHVMWDLSSSSIQRAEAALKQDWYGAKLILRLSDVTSGDTTSTSETPIRDIPVESDGRNWYINVPQPPRQYRVDIGYLSRRGDFFPIARSNVVTPPKAGSAEALDAGWEKDPKKAERIAAMSTGFESASHPELKALFEERLRRPLGAPKEAAFGTGATLPGNVKKFFFEIDAKLIVLGRTDPNAHLTLGNDPVDLHPDGTFMMSFSLPDSRQIIPAVATSADGVEERTIVLAIERNTKYLDPMIHDQMSEG
jgi:hypothetical protein